MQDVACSLLKRNHVKSSYQTAPSPTNKLPSGIPFIIANEFAERFSYYGMRAVLVIFMTQYLLDANGQADLMSDNEAKAYFHLFISLTYFTPFLGALLADSFLGKYRTIVLLSLVYCLGHFCLAIDITRLGLLLGQTLIALGAGGIKPCVSAHLGDQFGRSNQHRLSTVFSWFYSSINLGAFIAMLMVPWLLQQYGANIAFSVPGVLMLLATIIFYFGRYRFVHIPPTGKHFFKEVFSTPGRQCLTRLLSVYVFIAMFWALFDQIGSSWILQAQQMNREMAGIEILPSQIQATNPLLIVLLTPLFYKLVFPWLSTRTHLNYITKITLGLAFTVAAFSWVALLQQQLDAGLKLTIIWQLPAYLLLTMAEILVSVTCLEFSYTQAPNSMKALIMSLYMATVAVGNLFTSGVNFILAKLTTSHLLSGAAYFWFFTVLMLLTTLGFMWHNRHFKETMYLHAER